MLYERYFYLQTIYNKVFTTKENNKTYRNASNKRPLE